MKEHSELFIGLDVSKLKISAALAEDSRGAHIYSLTAYVVFPSWQVFIQALTTFTIPPKLLKTQKAD